MDDMKRSDKSVNHAASLLFARKLEKTQYHSQFTYVRQISLKVFHFVQYQVQSNK